MSCVFSQTRSHKNVNSRQTSTYLSLYPCFCMRTVWIRSVNKLKTFEIQREISGIQSAGYIPEYKSVSVDEVLRLLNNLLQCRVLYAVALHKCNESFGTLLVQLKGIYNLMARYGIMTPPLSYRIAWSMGVNSSKIPL